MCKACTVCTYVSIIVHAYMYWVMITIFTILTYTSVVPMEATYVYVDI